MTINPEWDELFKTRSWGKYPDLELVRFVKRTFPTGAKQVLELGCGTGANLRMLRAELFDVYGIDGSQEAVDKCSEFMPNVVSFGDVANIREIYDDLKFDLICDVGCFMHQTASDRLKIIADCYEQLKPGGYIFFSEMVSVLCSAYDDSLEQPDDLAFVRDPHFQPKIPYHFFDEKELLELFSIFERVELEYVTRSYNKRKRFYDRYYISGRKPA